MSCGSPSLKLTVTWCVVLSLVTSVSSTLTPSGSVSIDCGGQRTFTCTVPGTAGWIITGLMGISATGSTAGGVAAVSAKVTTPDTGLGTTSTITITGFNTSDNGGVVQCVDIGSNPVTNEGMATITVGPPRCGLVGVDYGNYSCPFFTFTPQGNVLPSTVVVSYQLVGDPSSARSLNCNYPIDPQMCELVVPEGTYTVRLTPQNNCGSPSSICLSFTESIRANCTLATRFPIAPAPDPVPVYIILPAAVLLIIFIIRVVLLVTRHCYKKSSKGGSSSRQEELYAQVEGKKVYEDINMTDSPAYGPTSHAAPPVYI